MHRDKSAAHFPEAIAWVAGRVRCDWQFAVPSASVAFSLDRAWPCFCLLQAADVVHGTLRAPVEHDHLGLAAVSRDVVSTCEARDTVRGKKART